MMNPFRNIFTNISYIERNLNSETTNKYNVAEKNPGKFRGFVFAVNLFDKAIISLRTVVHDERL